MATEHENWVDWAKQSAEAENRDLRIEWHAALARAEAAEAALANCQHDLGTMENKVDQAEAKLAQIPWAALRVIAEREKWMLPQSGEDRTFLAWLEVQP